MIQTNRIHINFMKTSIMMDFKLWNPSKLNNIRAHSLLIIDLKTSIVVLKLNKVTINIKSIGNNQYNNNQLWIDATLKRRENSNIWNI